MPPRNNTTSMTRVLRTIPSLCGFLHDLVKEALLYQVDVIMKTKMVLLEGNDTGRLWNFPSHTSSTVGAPAQC